MVALRSVKVGIDVENAFAKIDESIRPEFRTKLQIGAELVKQAVATIRRSTDKPIRLAFDGDCVSDKPFEKMKKLDVEIVTRFKKNSVFYKLPEAPEDSEARSTA